MNLDDITVPEIYTTSADFRFFLKWFKTALSKIQYDTENLADIYDPLKCPADLLWMLANTMGYKYDDRLPTSFNRLVLMYFMSMIRNRGSKDGMTIAAEVNLAQFNILKYAKDKEAQEHDDILYNRLEDTSIPINSVYVTPHVEEGYIDVVYFSEEVPIDACIEYVRPVGMLLRQYAGVKFDGKTKISIDARLTHINENNDLGIVASTRVGHYTRKDYARLQQTKVTGNHHVEDPSASEGKRDKLYERNPDVEGSAKADAGYRTLYSLQLCNNEHIVQSLLPIFGLGFDPQTANITVDDTYVLPDIDTPEEKAYNLRYDKVRETAHGKDVYTVENNDNLNPMPGVNPIMGSMGKLGDVMMTMRKDGKLYKVVYDENGRPILGEEISE